MKNEELTEKLSVYPYIAEQLCDCSLCMYIKGAVTSIYARYPLLSIGTSNRSYK